MKAQTKDKTIIYYRESFIQSILADIFTFTCMLIVAYINYKYIGNNWIVQIILLLGVLSFIAKDKKDKFVKTFTDKKELLDFIKNDLEKA